MLLANFFTSLETWQLWLLIAGAIIFVLLIAALVMFTMLRRIAKEKQSRQADKVKIKDGVRYSVDKEITEKNGNENVTFLPKDIVLKRGEVYIARKNGYLMPGKYTILTNAESKTAFNVRLGGFVREYYHGSEIVVGDGEEISSVSHTIVLR